MLLPLVAAGFETKNALRLVAAGEYFDQPCHRIDFLKKLAAFRFVAMTAWRNIEPCGPVRRSNDRCSCGFQRDIFCCPTICQFGWHITENEMVDMVVPRLSDGALEFSVPVFL